MMHLAAFILFSSFVQSNSAQQTSWSLGPGLYGPFPSWGYSRFHESLGINWHPFTARLQLQPRSKTVIGDEFDGARLIVVSDMDGDGYPDIVACGTEADEVAWWENPYLVGDSDCEPSWVKHVIVAGYDYACSAAVQDIDGDGDLDVTAAAWDMDRIAWWENSDTAPGMVWTEHSVSSECSGASAVASQDMDGDGDIDIAGASSGMDMVLLWENVDGTGLRWLEHTVHTGALDVLCLQAGDIDGDGDSDLTGAVFNGNDVVWWENSGSVLWLEHQICSTSGPRSISLSDIDSDGDQDVLVASSELLWCENIGGSSWVKHCIDSYSEPLSVCSGDMDGDGDLDVVATSSPTQNMVSWWENTDGTGTEWIMHIVDTAVDYPYGVGAADMNDDGSLEVIATSWHEDQIIIWDSTLEGYESSGSLSSTILDSEIADASWGYWDWESVNPESTSVAFQFRISDDPLRMGVWSDTLYSPGYIYDFFNTDGRYFQYRAILTSADSMVTPFLNSVSISWNHVDISKNISESVNITPLCVTPNPVVDHAAISFHTPSGSGTLTIYNIAGRICGFVTIGEGLNSPVSVDFEALSPGIYYCRLSAGLYDDVCRFAVIE